MSFGVVLLTSSNNLGALRKSSRRGTSRGRRTCSGCNGTTDVKVTVMTISSIFKEEISV